LFKARLLSQLEVIDKLQNYQLANITGADLQKTASDLWCTISGLENRNGRNEDRHRH
jgi:hypothetical protein